MTDAEKALLWARRSGVPVPHHQTVAEAYLVGAAVSAERIKELEAFIRRLREWDQMNPPMTGFVATLTTEQKAEAMAYEGDDHHGPSPDALLKEPDEPTDEDRYGWGGQG